MKRLVRFYEEARRLYFLLDSSDVCDDADVNHESNSLIQRVYRLGGGFGIELVRSFVWECAWIELANAIPYALFPSAEPQIGFDSICRDQAIELCTMIPMSDDVGWRRLAEDGAIAGFSDQDLLDYLLRCPVEELHAEALFEAGARTGMQRLLFGYEKRRESWLAKHLVLSRAFPIDPTWLDDVGFDFLSLAFDYVSGILSEAKMDNVEVALTQSLRNMYWARDGFRGLFREGAASLDSRQGRFLFDAFSGDVPG